MTTKAVNGNFCTQLKNFETLIFSKSLTLNEAVFVSSAQMTMILRSLSGLNSDGFLYVFCLSIEKNFQ